MHEYNVNEMSAELLIISKPLRYMLITMPLDSIIVAIFNSRDSITTDSATLTIMAAV